MHAMAKALLDRNHRRRPDRRHHGRASRRVRPRTGRPRPARGGRRRRSIPRGAPPRPEGRRPARERGFGPVFFVHYPPCLADHPLFHRPVARPRVMGIVNVTPTRSPTAAARRRGPGPRASELLPRGRHPRHRRRVDPPGRAAGAAGGELDRVCRCCRARQVRRAGPGGHRQTRGDAGGLDLRRRHRQRRLGAARPGAEGRAVAAASRAAASA